MKAELKEHENWCPYCEGEKIIGVSHEQGEFGEPISWDEPCTNCNGTGVVCNLCSEPITPEHECPVSAADIKKPI